MISLATRPRSSFQSVLYLAGILMPYLAVWLGLYLFHSGWAAILGYHAGIILLVTLAKAWPKLSDFHPNAPMWKVALFALTGLSAGVVVYFLWPFVYVSPAFSDALLDWGLTPRVWPVFILYSGLVNPWLEEIFWRGWLGSAATHPIWQDFIFGGFHLVILAPFISLFWMSIALLILAFSGWIWRQVDRVEKSMLATSLFHMAADVSILLVVWSTVRR